MKKNEKKEKKFVCKTPTILQMEATECGAASLAIVCAYYKKYVPLEEMRISCGIGRDGSKATNILKAARSYGFEAKGYKCEPAALKTIELPAIIHWDFNHFLVLEGFDKDKIYLNDPALGHRIVSEEEFDQSFTGIVIALKPGEEFESGGRKQSITALINDRIKGSKKALVYLLLTGLCLTVFGILVPAFSKIFIDDILAKNRISWAGVLFGAMIGTLILQIVVYTLQQHFMLILHMKISVSSSSKFLWHILRLPINFFSQRYAGDISLRMSSNDTIADFLSEHLITMCINMLMLVFYFTVMAAYSIPLTLVGVLGISINVLCFMAVSGKRAEQNSRLQQDTGKFVGAAMNGIQMIETLKANGTEDDFFESFAGAHGKTISMKQKLGSSSQYLSNLPTFITALTDVGVLIIGGIQAVNGEMTMGSLFAFRTVMAGFMAPVTAMMQMGERMITMHSDMMRLDDVTNYKIENKFLKENKEIFKYTKLHGFVELDNVTFGYNVLEPPLIENFCLKLEPGKSVALVGSSGSGKSTVGKLISGLYKPWSGNLLFDGTLRDDVPAAVITDSVAVVDQEISMFSGTVRDNLTLWDKTIEEHDILRAAKDALIHDDITQKPQGYDFKMTEDGANFSGGQKQRMEIARALVNNPTILIFDEATSALDPITEQKINENIRRRGLSLIVIAHRLSTIRDCDEIIVLEKGKIVQRGNHEKLMETGGAYKELISMGDGGGLE